MPTNTYLVYVNRVLRGFNEAELSSSNFATAGGFYADVKDAVNSSIQEIHQSEEYQWPFNISKGTVTLTADGEQEFELDASAILVDWSSFYIKNQTIGSEEINAQRIRPISLDEYRRHYKVQDDNKTSLTDYSKPERLVRNLNNKLIVSPPANLAYEVEYDYWTVPTTLSAATDTTTIPDTYENVVVAGARYYAYMFRDNYESAAVELEKFNNGIDMMRRVLAPERPYIIPDN